MVKRCCYQYYYCIGGSHGFLPGAKGWLWSWAFFRIWAYSGPLSPRKSNGDVAAVVSILETAVDVDFGDSLSWLVGVIAVDSVFGFGVMTLAILGAVTA
ncbi:hypothetical protein M0R45_002202 [Rubus argutus]|uniref:Uncharacterized protein n=1 Tax=Rubus argutus TaxID=59490 RepID=A0AAW1VRT0_RUBAR